MKEFRVLNIMDTTMEGTNQRVAVVELAELEYQNFTLSSGTTPYTFGTEGKRFVVDFNSYIARQIIEKAKQEEIVSLDLSEFRFRNELKDGRQEKIGYHKNVHLIGYEESPFEALHLDDISYSISFELNKKLENAFEDLKKDTSNPLVIAQLQSDDKEVNLYLVAKDPNENMYYGILENEFVEERQLAGIPESNIRAMEVKEIPMTPFWCKPYIEQNIKRHNQMNLENIFKSNKVFREKIIFIHYAKSKNYIAAKSDDLLFALGFSKGIDSIPICISTTQSVKGYSTNENGEIEYEFGSGFLGLPTYLNIVELFPLLSKYCYKSMDSSELLLRMKDSKNGQLLAFRDTLIAKANPNKLNELVKLLNEPEANPDISGNENISNLDILVLNKGAYERIFKDLITEEILEPYRKK